MLGVNKKSGIFFDTYPKEGSDNAVTSDGIFKAIQAGGGGGASDYTMLSNKPRINNVELTGNKSLTSLGIASISELNTVKSDIQDINADIIDLEENKADKSQLPNMSLYTTKVETQALADRVTENETDIATLETAVQTKANSSTVTSLESRVTDNETDIETINTVLPTKADTTTVSNINTRVAQAENNIEIIQNILSGISTDTDFFKKIGNVFYPIGSIYISEDSTDPSNIFGGTWQATSTGRALAGVGQSADSNGVTRNFTYGTINGEYVHTLIVGELPAHDHYVKCASQSFANGTVGWVGPVNASQSGENRTTTQTGGGSSHNNIQPCWAVYIWKRLTLYTP